jgi:hypothetical protein
VAEIASDQIFHGPGYRDFQERLVITIRKTMSERYCGHRFPCRSELLQETVNLVTAKAEGRPRQDATVLAHDAGVVAER